MRTFVLDSNIISYALKLEPLEKHMWDLAASLYANLRKKGISIGDADLLIAAFTLENEYILVTNNVRHFENIVGIRYVNWHNDILPT